MTNASACSNLIKMDPGWDGWWALNAFGEKEVSRSIHWSSAFLKFGPWETTAENREGFIGSGDDGGHTAGFQDQTSFSPLYI